MLVIGSLKEARKKNKIFFLIIFPILLTLFALGIFQEFFIVVEALTVAGKLTVPSPINVELTIYLDDQPCPSQLKAYCLGNEIKISNELKNVGGFDISGNLSTKIINSSYYVINQTDWFNVNVSSRETLYKNTSYTIRENDEKGIFSIISNYTYNGNYTNEICEFEVWKGIGNFLVSENELLFFIPPGKSRVYDPPLKLRLQYACDNTIVNMNTSLNAPGNWTSFDPDKVFLLSTGEENSTNITVAVPIDINLGPYYGWIYANADGQQIPINLTVVVTIIDFYIKTKIPDDKKEVCQGRQIYAEVNITKISPSGKVDFNVTYQLLNEGNVIAETKENLTLNDTLNSTIRIPILTVPSNAPTGDYTFLSHLDYEQVFYESADEFKVKYCPEPPKEEDGGGGGGGVAPPPTGPPVKKQLVLNLSTNLISVTTGNRTSFVATVENTGNTGVEDVKISIEGIPSNWIETIPSIVNIPAKGTQGYLVIINVPSHADTGIYKLTVQATDDIQSNTDDLTLVIGRNIKEIADLMLIEYQKLLKEATESLLVEDCLDITLIKIMHEDAQLAFAKGLEEYEKKNYAKVVNWFEYAIPLEQKVISRVDISIEMELLASNSSKIIIPPFYESEEQFIRAQAYLEEKNYEDVCDPIVEIRKAILIGLIFWPGIVIIIVFLVILFVFFYKYRRRRERSKILEEVKKRLILET